jgi:hypothetical protein
MKHKMSAVLLYYERVWLVDVLYLPSKPSSLSFKRRLIVWLVTLTIGVVSLVIIIVSIFKVIFVFANLSRIENSDL